MVLSWSELVKKDNILNLAYLVSTFFAILLYFVAAINV
jgi:hypothetical protein